MSYQGIGRQDITGTWWVALLEGIALLILGILLLLSPAMTTIVLIQFLGIYWLVSGIFSIIEIFVRGRDVQWGWELVFGIIGILAGIAVLRHPLLSAVLIPTLLIVYLGIAGLVMGVLGLIQGMTGRGGWAVVLGILDILFGAILLFRPLYAAIWLPIFVGILAVVGGIVLILSSFQMRRRAVSSWG